MRFHGPAHIVVAPAGEVLLGAAPCAARCGGRAPAAASSSAQRPHRRAQRRRLPDALGLLGRHRARRSLRSCVGAQPPLARAHGDGRVALEQLGGVEALADRDLDVLDVDVLAEADVAARCRTSSAPRSAAARTAASPRGGGDAGLLAARQRLVERAARLVGAHSPASDDGQVVGQARQVVVGLDLGADREQVARDRLGAAARARTTTPLTRFLPVASTTSPRPRAEARRRRVEPGRGDDGGDRDAGVGQRAGVHEAPRAARAQTTARSPGLTPWTPASRAAPRARNTPGRSLPLKTLVGLHAAAGDRRSPAGARGGRRRARRRSAAAPRRGRCRPRRRARSTPAWPSTSARRRVDLAPASGPGATRAPGCGFSSTSSTRLPSSGRGERRREARHAGADDEHVGVPVGALEVARRVGRVREAEAGHLADDLLRHRPRELRLAPSTCSRSRPASRSASCR